MAMFGQNLTIPAIVKVAKPARLLWELLSREQQEVKKMARDLTHRPAKTSNLLRLFRMQQKWKKNCSRQTADYYYESLQFDEKESLSRDFPNFFYICRSIFLVITSWLYFFVCFLNLKSSHPFHIDIWIYSNIFIFNLLCFMPWLLFKTMTTQKYSRLRCLLRVKGLVICFYLGWSGSILQFRQNIIKV